MIEVRIPWRWVSGYASPSSWDALLEWYLLEILGISARVVSHQMRATPAYAGECSRRDTEILYTLFVRIGQDGLDFIADAKASAEKVREIERCAAVAHNPMRKSEEPLIHFAPYTADWWKK